MKLLTMKFPSFSWLIRLFAGKNAAEEFAEAFPGRCMICSYHAYGISHGYGVGPLEAHDCIEGNVPHPGVLIPAEGANDKAEGLPVVVE